MAIDMSVAAKMLKDCNSLSGTHSRKLSKTEVKTCICLSCRIYNSKPLGNNLNVYIHTHTHTHTYTYIIHKYKYIYRYIYIVLDHVKQYREKQIVKKHVKHFSKEEMQVASRHMKWLIQVDL